MNILSVDPGKETGYAIWSNGVFASGHLPHMEFLNIAFGEFMPPGGPKWFDLLVVEDFIVTAQTLKKSRGENWSLEQIGALRWMAQLARVDFALQKPGDAKSFVSNDRLKKLSWYVPGVDHPNDAARHLLLAIANRDPETFKQLASQNLRHVR